MEEKTKSFGWKGGAAAFISIHACHNMYIFAGDPSITRGLSDHGGVNTVGGGGAEGKVCMM